MSCRASGRVPGVHRRSYSRTAHEWYWACAVRLDPCFEQRRPNPHAVSVADQAQSRLVGRRYPVLHTQCAGITRVQSVGFRPSRSTRGANPEAALAPRAFLAPSCEGAVRERRLEFSDSVDAAGTGPSPAPICPRTNAPCGRRPRSPWPRPRPYSLFDGIYYSDNRSNSRANTCNKPRLLEGMHLLDKRSTRALPVAAMIHDNSTDRTAIVPATHHSNFCPINFRW
ncbi:hypothetical protein RDI58_032295 [Solanum bulbocastanum]|uniref:Uncharacterized protein n=1 Tax=Solanum bulbocastanum TaxID=147425 RepID=A0AAN8SJ92_SOLBU